MKKAVHSQNLKNSLIIIDHPLLLMLKDLGITFYAGVTGGGVIHFLKYIPQYYNGNQLDSSFLSIAEYTAGFIPLGYFLASKKVSAAIATTGAASKLIACGMSDAKLHNIPSIYIIPETDSDYSAPGALQDSSAFGNNIVLQFQAELPESTFILNESFSFAENIKKIYDFIKQGKPIAFILTKQSESLLYDNTLRLSDLQEIADNDINSKLAFQQKTLSFITKFKKTLHHKRLVIIVGEELIHCSEAKKITTLLSEGLQAETIWSMNGANYVSRKNKYGYGHIGFGGNDFAMDIFDSIKEEDCVLLLGLCADEYTTNFKKIEAADVFYISHAKNIYGLIDNDMPHFINGNLYKIQGDLDYILGELADDIQKDKYSNIPAEKAPENLNKNTFESSRKGYVDMANLYMQLDSLWPKNSFAVKDVCLAYKDHQYVISRPNDNIDFISLYRGSAMGGAFGIAVGAKIAAPDKNVYCFTGDGCFRLFAGNMAEAADLGIVVFLLNNRTLGIVSQGLQKVLPNMGEEAYHSFLKSIDYCAVANSFGWKSYKLLSDMSNLRNIFEQINPNMKQSVLIELDVDPDQNLGNNPRLKNL